MLHPTQCLIARTDQELDQVFRTRYSSYRCKGSIKARADERFARGSV
jgi:hypothetical protein